MKEEILSEGLGKEVDGFLLAGRGDCWERESSEFLQREGGGKLEASHAHSGSLRMPKGARRRRMELILSGLEEWVSALWILNSTGARLLLAEGG